MRGILIYQAAKEIRVEHRENLVNGSQEQRKDYQPFIWLEINEQYFHTINRIVMAVTVEAITIKLRTSSLKLTRFH